MFSAFLLLVIAYLIHQKMIDWGCSYSHDKSALDELVFREVLKQDLETNLFIYALIFVLYVFAINISPTLSAMWTQCLVGSFNFFMRL